MNRNSSVEIHPKFKELLDQYDSLKEELIKLLTDRDYLFKVEKRNLEADYQLKIGKKEYELFLVRLETLRLKRKVELLQAAFNKQIKCSIEEVEAQLDQEFTEWQQNAKKR